jgi:hypothetical protein
MGSTAEKSASTAEKPAATKAFGVRRRYPMAADYEALRVSGGVVPAITGT